MFYYFNSCSTVHIDIYLKIVPRTHFEQNNKLRVSPLTAGTVWAALHVEASVPEGAMGGAGAAPPAAARQICTDALAVAGRGVLHP